MKRRRQAALFLPLLLLTLFGCQPAALHLEADRLTYDAVAPEYLQYVDADPRLDDEQRARRRRTVEAWSARLELAGGDR